jgi:hypothetical protein
MRAVVRLVAFTVAALGGVFAGAVVGCSLVTELGDLSGGETGAPGSLDGAADAGVDTGGAMADGAPSCEASVSVDDAFTASLGEWRPHSTNLVGYPNVEDFEGARAAVFLPNVPPHPDGGGAVHTFAAAALWIPQVVPLHAFDLELEFFVLCRSDLVECADGLNIVWLDATSTSLLTNSNTGHMAALPPGTAGAGIVLDTYPNGRDETNDLVVPAIELIQLDPTKPLGAYDWKVAIATPPFPGAWHKLDVSVRDGAVSVRYDGRDVLTSSVRSFARGLFGMTAGSGENADAVAVRNLHARFYECAPPPR